MAKARLTILANRIALRMRTLNVVEEALKQALRFYTLFFPFDGVTLVDHLLSIYKRGEDGEGFAQTLRDGQQPQTQSLRGNIEAMPMVAGDPSLTVAVSNLHVCTTVQRSRWWCSSPANP